jgi:shikimate dehydrogenase
MPPNRGGIVDTTSITKDTVLCISLAGRPSSIGTRFHNHLYAELGLDFVYKAFTTSDLAAAVAGIRGLGIRGCGISMPFKEAVIDLVDSLDDSALAIGSVNTIVNDDGHLSAYNTDYLAIEALVGARGPGASTSFAVLGSGGMARAVVAALHALGYESGTVVARNEASGRALAEHYGYPWAPSLGSTRPEFLVNATPIGMAGGPEEAQLAFAPAVVDSARVVLEVVAVPEQTPLVRRARAAGIPVITGTEVIARQAAEQFTLYTGVRPTPDQVARAATFSRGG